VSSRKKTFFGFKLHLSIIVDSLVLAFEFSLVNSFDSGEQDVEIGTPVEMVTRRLRIEGDERGVLVYGYKFRPRL
jgi:hypothetical protein